MSKARDFLDRIVELEAERDRLKEAWHESEQVINGLREEINRLKAEAEALSRCTHEEATDALQYCNALDEIQKDRDAWKEIDCLKAKVELQKSKVDFRAEAYIQMKTKAEKLAGALKRLFDSYKLSVASKPVRCLDEVFEEVKSALAEFEGER